ncbi:MAG: hypothetical protein KBG58_02190 [Giesbergeria sp.]|nr:hypothetical protein [Giesbergeria sp.]MBP6321743.1 hypothetical protein [Giesbergeria sp.]MBP7916128.1 hypothetical protein [Giesbergeria sp.]MBP8029040.1 hypothetical protein [Giesbergeria sp.]MBP8839446.1 hypothetical protein [Giesbergeria sp.]
MRVFISACGFGYRRFFIVACRKQALQPAQALVYDAGRNVNEHFYMADSSHAAMDTAALLALIETPEPDPPAVLSATP